MLSGKGLCDGLIIRPEESYRLWRVIVCDKETSNTEAKARYGAVENTTTVGCKAEKTNNKQHVSATVGSHHQADQNNVKERRNMSTFAILIVDFEQYTCVT